MEETIIDDSQQNELTEQEEIVQEELSKEERINGMVKNYLTGCFVVILRTLRIELLLY